MSVGRYQELVEYLERRAGDYFRAAISYDREGWEILYFRDDLDQQTFRDRLPHLHEVIQERQAIVREDEYPPLGESEGAIELHENGTLLHLREGDGYGVVVTLDKNAGRNLAGFVDECRKILRQS